MATKSKAKTTYITYNSGIDIKKLHLGNLVHDIKNPAIYDPYVEKTYTDIEEPPPFWANATQLENFALTLGKDSTTPDPKTGHKYRVAAAPKGVKLEIKEPAKFFQNVTLKSDPAKKWLTAHLSASPTPEKTPPIYILTGLILLTHTTWSSLTSPEVFTPGTPAPFDPTGVNKLRRLSSSGEVRPVFGLEDVVSGGEEHGKEVGNRATVLETGKYPGTRAWGCQWRKLDVEFLKGEQWEGDVGQLALKRKDGSVAEVEVDESEDGIATEGENDEFDDTFWDRFLDAAEELM